MSTGGAAINATIKQMAAASNVGIINTPNHPTYNLLSVDVIQLQNCSQVFDCRCCEIVAVIFLTVSKTIREMVELLCSRHPQAGYERRNLYTHRSRLAGVQQC